MSPAGPHGYQAANAAEPTTGAAQQVFAIRVSAGPPPTIEVSGEFDRETAAVVSVCVDGQLRRHREPYVVLDLAGVTYLDAEGLRVIAEAERRCAERGGCLRLRIGTHHTVARALTITGLMNLVQPGGPMA